MEEYRTRGDAAVTFSPNEKNRYYLFQKPLPLIAHAYRVKNDNGDVTPVDNAENQNWEANGAGNGDTTWETVDGVAQSAASWVGGRVHRHLWQMKRLSKRRWEIKVVEDGVSYIKDDKGNTYRIPDKITDAVITYTGDQLSKVDSGGDGKYTEGSNSFSSDDYFFLCIEYYLPMGGVGKDIEGEDAPGTQAVRKVSRMIARQRLGVRFGAAFRKYRQRRYALLDRYQWQLQPRNRIQFPHRHGR